MSLKNCFKFLVLSVLFLTACEGDEEAVENKELEKKLIGEWRNVSLKLTMNTFSNKDSTKVFEVNEEDWERKMNIRPIKTIYFADGTYISEHRNLRDSIIYSPAGRWVILGDTVIMRDTFPELGLSYRYKININKDLVEFTGIEDCDRDGSADDQYFGVQRKQKFRGAK